MTHRDLNAEFTQLLAEHEGQIFGLLCATVCNIDAAEDLFQQTMLTMWEKFEEFEVGTSFLAWGCEVARLKALAYTKQAAVHNRLSATMIDLLTRRQQEDDGLFLARRRALSACLEKLNSTDRELIEKFYGSRQTAQQLSGTLQRSAEGIYNALSRIRMRLYRCIQATVQREGS